MKRKNWLKQIDKIYLLLAEGTKEDMLALEGTDLLYHIYSDMRGMDIIMGYKGYKDFNARTHFDGHFEDMACLVVFGQFHDFRTEEQKKGFRYRLYINPCSTAKFHISLCNIDDSFELLFSSGFKENCVEEKIRLSMQDFDDLFSTVKPEELLTFSLMKNFNGLFGIGGSIYLDGKENGFFYPVYVENRVGQIIIDSMLCLLDMKLTDPLCRAKLNKVKEYFDEAVYYSFVPESWIKLQDRGYVTDFNFPHDYQGTGKPEIIVGSTFVDETGRRYMLRGIEMFSGWLANPTEEQQKRTGMLLRPLGENDGNKPDRLYYVSG